MDTNDLRKIQALERQLISDKPWQLKGEVVANARPVNSLLFEDVNFEQRVKAPTITQETTENLEEIIKTRIKDNKYDDPIRKVKPTSSFVKDKQFEVSSERNKVGLAQLYEQEIIAKATGPNQHIKDGPDKEIENKLFALFRKLDALVDR